MTLAFYIVHNVVEGLAEPAGVVDRDHVGVTEAGQDAGFVEKTFGAGLAVVFRSQDLDRDRSVENGVPGEENRAHAAAGQFALDLVLRG
jgi:hypothetical protein